jgi:CheY-like chemotaxis protein
MPAFHHVLIVEFNDRVRALLARVVARTYPEITITAVTSGTAALMAYYERGADLLITAHRLPALTGIQLVRALRTQHVAIPILVISSDPIELAALSAGATRFLPKPFTLTEIQQVLIELLPLEAAI